MAARWANIDTALLKKSLVDGFPVQQMMTLFPNRSKGAIKLKAQEFGFGVKTSKNNGITRFYANIKSRLRHTSILPEIDEVDSIFEAIEASQHAKAVPSNYVDHIESPIRIIAYDGFSANALVVKMFKEYCIDADPDVICALSLHILKNKR